MHRSLLICAVCVTAAIHPAAAQNAGSPTLAGESRGPARSPATQRLRELIAAVETGNTRHIARFLQESCAPEYCQRTDATRASQNLASLQDRSRGFAIDSVYATATDAVALVRNRLTGLLGTFSVRVEPYPPYRITGPSPLAMNIPRHPLSKATDAERIAEVDRLARKLASVDAFSGVILVGRGDSIQYLQAFGFADRTAGIRMQPDTRFHLTWLAQPFISVAIAQLVEENRLSWDDPVTRILPELSTMRVFNDVTIRHLVTHSSGLWELGSRAVSPESHRAPVSLEDHVREALSSQMDAPRFSPGTSAEYTNTNFVIVAAIIERITSQPYHRVIEKRILSVAGTTRSGFAVDGRAAIDIAQGYEKRFDSENASFTEFAPLAQFTGYPAPYAGMYGTATDVFRFLAAFRRGALVQQQTFLEMLTSKPESSKWALGFEIRDASRGIAGYVGNGLGQSHSIDLFTQSDHTVVILSNYSGARSPLREAIADLLP